MKYARISYEDAEALIDAMPRGSASQASVRHVLRRLFEQQEPSSIDGHPPMTDAHMLHFVNGSLSAIEEVSLDRMKAAVVKLRGQVKKHLGVE